MTPHFSFKELVSSQTAQRLNIHNLPLDSCLSNLHFTAAGLERCRALLNFPIKILSGYRCEALNRAVGGSKFSQHMKGEAADITCPAFGTPRSVAQALSENVKILGIDQLILERTWVHLSFTLSPRYDILTQLPSGGYVQGLV